MKWTSDKPTQDGLYWLYSPKDFKEKVSIVKINIKRKFVYFLGWEVKELLNTIEGLWYGPLSPPCYYDDLNLCNLCDETRIGTSEKISQCMKKQPNFSYEKI